MSRLRTITKDKDLLDAVHPGDILRHDFLIGSEIPVDEVAQKAGIDPARLSNILDRKAAVDACTDLRLARYFGVSEGIFLGLQNDFEIDEARRVLNRELDRITPHAA